MKRILYNGQPTGNAGCTICDDKYNRHEPTINTKLQAHYLAQTPTETCFWVFNSPLTSAIGFTTQNKNKIIQSVTKELTH